MAEILEKRTVVEIKNIETAPVIAHVRIAPVQHWENEQRIGFQQRTIPINVFKGRWATPINKILSNEKPRADGSQSVLSCPLQSLFERPGDYIFVGDLNSESVGQHTLVPMIVPADVPHRVRFLRPNWLSFADVYRHFGQEPPSTE